MFILLISTFRRSSGISGGSTNSDYGWTSFREMSLMSEEDMGRNSIAISERDMAIAEAELKMGAGRDHRETFWKY